MAKISDIDKNFEVKTDFSKENICWINALSNPIFLFGVFHDGERYKRMDTEVAKSVSNGVTILHTNTSGGRITFETDSPYVAISVKGGFCHMPHMAFTGSAGFDLMVWDNGCFNHFATFVPPVDNTSEYTSIVEFPNKKMRKILIHFPLYSDVYELNLGFDGSSVINAYNPYDGKPPVVYYGSSITQGGCASRPANNYPAIVSAKTLTDFVCLGFSGNAHGEDEMREYIASLPMSAFVLDYDHNDCDNPERMRKTHPSLYERVRETHPDIPIIIMTEPYSYRREEPRKANFAVIEETYLKARQRGDNVYFIDGHEMFGEEYKTCGTVDGCHPNDFGFVKMAEAVLKCLK